MDLIELCEHIAATYVARTREHALTEVRAAVVRCTAALEASGRLALLAACDREWIVAHVEVNLDFLLQRIIATQDIEQLVDEVLSVLALPPVPAPLPVSLVEGECWQAVDIDGKLYCCDCRSLYEGTPLGEGAVDTLSEETAPYCASCGREL